MIVRPERVALIGLGLLVCLLVHAAPPLDAPFTLTPPGGLHAAPVARAATGNTYAWLPADLGQPVRLMITAMPVAEIRARFGALSDTQCMRLFLDELRAEYGHFFAVEQATPLALGPARLKRVRWTGDKGARTLTGVLACGELAGYYYVVHYVDALERATYSFPTLRAALATLEPNAP